MATEIVKIVDPDNGAGTDYTSLAAFEAALPASLVAVDEQWTAKCRCSNGTADTNRVIISGATTDITRYVKIWADPSENYRHEGVWSAAKYRISCANSQTIEDTIEVSTAFVIIDGLQIENVVSGNNYASGIAIPLDNVTSRIVISNCLVKISSSSSGTWENYGVASYSSSEHQVYIYNTIVYGASQTNGKGFALGGASDQSNIYTYNCTVLDCYLGFIREGSSVVVAKNCYAQGSSLAYSGTITKTTCASSDTTGSAGLQNIAVNTTNFTNVTAGSEDFRLPGTGSALYHTGTDTSGDSAPLNFTTDINGDTYFSTRSIGADEYVASGGGGEYTSPFPPFRRAP